MIYLSGGTDAFRQTLLIELYPKKAGLMSAKRGEKAMKIQSPCGFPQGFRCLHVHYTLSHIENQPAAKKFMFTMFDEKARISDIFLGFVRIFSDFRQNSGMLKILCILMQKNFCSLFTFPVFGIPLIGSPAHQQSTGLLMLPSCFLRTQQNFAFCGKRLKALP